MANTPPIEPLEGCSSWFNCSPSQYRLVWRKFDPKRKSPEALARESARVPLEHVGDYRFTERDLDFLSAGDLRRLAAHLLAEIAKRDHRVQGGDRA